jgi:hypothetical protein
MSVLNPQSAIIRNPGQRPGPGYLDSGLSTPTPPGLYMLGCLHACWAVLVCTMFVCVCAGAAPPLGVGLLVVAAPCAPVSSTDYTRRMSAQFCHTCMLSARREGGGGGGEHLHALSCMQNGNEHGGRNGGGNELCVPHWCRLPTFTIPTPGQQVWTGLEVGRNLDFVRD